MRILALTGVCHCGVWGPWEAKGQARLVRCGAINTPAGVPHGPSALVQIQEDLETLITSLPRTYGH